VTEDTINIGVAEYRVIHSPSVLASYGLGSCVAIALYDEAKRIGGLAHIMLPDSRAISREGREARFADTAIQAMVKEMAKLGARKNRITARIAGGAQMFSIPGASNPANIPGPAPGLHIGERNVESTRRTLKELNIPLLAEDTGGSHGRTMYFDVGTGEVTITSIRHVEKKL
jgi:chemotaxis protein CheD